MTVAGPKPRVPIAPSVMAADYRFLPGSVANPFSFQVRIGQKTEVV